YRAVGDPRAGCSTDQERDVSLALTNRIDGDIAGEVGVALRTQRNQIRVHEDRIATARAAIGVADESAFDHVDAVGGSDGIPSCQHQALHRELEMAGP